LDLNAGGRSTLPGSQGVPLDFGIWVFATRPGGGPAGPPRLLGLESVRARQTTRGAHVRRAGRLDPRPPPARPPAVRSGLDPVPGPPPRGVRRDPPRARRGRGDPWAGDPRPPPETRPGCRIATGDLW